MKEYPRIEGLSKEQCDAIFGQIAQLAREKFGNLNLSNDLVKTAQILLLKKSMPQDPAEITPEFIAKILFPMAVDRLFKGFQKKCSRLACSQIQDEPLSEDIAQEAIKLLLLSPVKVKSVGAWLIGTTYKLLLKHHERSEKDDELYQKLNLEAKFYDNWLISGDLMLLKDFSPALFDRILKTDEYQQYQEISSFDNIKAYAEAQGITEAAARKRKEVILRNLRSLALRSLGWHDTAQILSYNQYHAIQKFIREVVRMCSGDRSIKWIKYLSPEQAEAVKNVKNITEWSVAATGDLSFRLYLFTMFEDEQPFLITFNIAMDERNSISIQECQINQLHMTIPDTAQVNVPLEKGRAIWNYNRIISLLREEG